MKKDKQIIFSTLSTSEEKERIISEFKKAVAKGKEKEFLSTLHWISKVKLEGYMGLLDMGLPRSRETLTKKEQRYLDILEDSIDKDRMKEALNQGFSSIEEWKANNARIFNERDEELCNNETHVGGRRRF